MQYECNGCHKVFLYPAKIIDATPSYTPPNVTTSATPVISNNRTLEYHVCPYCMTIDLKEHVEGKSDITALIEVPHAEVNDRIAEGYVVMEDKIYAKLTIMIKRAEPKGDYVADALAVAAKSADLGEQTLKEAEP